MSKLSRLSFGILATGAAIAAPLAGHAGASPLIDAIGRASHSSERGSPAADPVPDDFLFHLLNPHPCVSDTVVLVVAGFDPTPCDSFIEAFARDSAHVVYHTQVRGCFYPTDEYPARFYPIRIPLGRFPGGPQRIDIEWVIDHADPGTVVVSEVRHIPIDFVVSAECVAFGHLPFVDHVQIGPPNGSNPPCIVSGDSIPVTVSGFFPNDCFRLVGIELLPDLTASPEPHAPRVRVTVDDQACAGMICRLMPVPWSASITLPPLTSSAYKLPLEVARVSCTDHYPPGDLFVAGFPFAVSQHCGLALGCPLPSFDPHGQRHECDASIGAGQPAHLTLYLRSPAPLAGFQGELDLLGDPATHITQLAPTGAAAGMLLRWAATPHGAKFALVADQGASIPPTPVGEPAPAVLAIDLEPGAGPPPPVTILSLIQFAVADTAGRALVCPAMVVPAPIVARICSGSGPAGHCDFNGDGREDIRDLVLMVRCLRDSSLCGDSTARFDCNQDGAFTLDDVLCCAGRILGQDCAGCPPGQTRDARDLKLGLGPPMGRIPSPGLPVRIEGATSVGGARLTLHYPDDRYDVSGVDFGAASPWIHVTQVSGGRVVIGLINAAQVQVPETEIAFTLHLALKPGREPGGEVSLESAELTGPDGVRLLADVPALRQPLGGTPKVALSESRPNPFAGSTRFAVTIDRPGMVEVAIYDLGGRRLVTLHRGELPAGTREFSWDGRQADGTRARDGVYFYRAAAGSETLARKLVLLRGP